MINIGISGCCGRMGQAITRLAREDNHIRIKTLLEHDGHDQVGQSLEGITISSNPDDLQGCDVFIDFTLPVATIKNLKACLKHNVQMVIGTTGFKEEERDALYEASKKIGMVLSGNMSLGVNILFKLTQILAKTAPEYYKASIIEAHHIHKKDAPSGTAKMLENFIDHANISNNPNSKRDRKQTESIREGEIIGDHSVTFDSPEDSLVISHHAKNRDIFAKGALVAAKFISGKSNGFFDMQDVLGIK
ncbi:MAG: 4-hydroxy-tetrahydrodipicolinate reductase [Candidatus Omnitrophica bacterium]|nr:4-hydroxy-tetrahydrodipicolinate reductase [Candidatus Omnitrophota bacterium]